AVRAECRMLDVLPGRGEPQRGTAIDWANSHTAVSSRQQEKAAVRAKHWIRDHRLHVRWRRQGFQQFPRLHVFDADGAVWIEQGQPPAVGAERHRPGAVSVPQMHKLLAGRHLANAGFSLVFAEPFGDGNEPAVRAQAEPAAWMPARKALT